jgi:hypothetical protein
VVTFTIEINGYGGEMVLGSVSKEAFEHWSVKDEDDEGINGHLFWDPYEESDGNEITDDEDPRFLGNWHEIDDIDHSHGAFYDQCEVIVTNEDGETIYETDSPEIESTHISDPDDQPEGYYFKGWSTEKGNFFSCDIELDNFDPDKLKFGATNIDCDVVIDSVTYDGEDLDNIGGDTRSKSVGWDFYENL